MEFVNRDLSISVTAKQSGFMVEQKELIIFIIFILGSLRIGTSHLNYRDICILIFELLAIFTRTSSSI